MSREESSPHALTRAGANGVGRAELERMRHLGTAALAALTLACGNEHFAHSDAAIAADAAPDSSVPPDSGDPYCHWDCFGGHRCEDGIVYSYAHRPIPCDEWTGACPEGPSFTCERGCRADGVTLGEPSWPPVAMCEEGRPKVAGDPCTEDAHCEPASGSGSYETIDRTHLECDEASMTCVPIPDPTPADWLGPCGADLAYLLDPTDTGYVFGFVEDPSCAGAVCLVFEGDTCVANACSVPCETDDDCPDASYCRDRFDRTRRDGGSGPYTRVCEPLTGIECH